MKLSKIYALAVLSLFTLTVSCDDDDLSFQEPEPQALSYKNGILIANEGGFTSPTSSVSYISSDFSQFESNIFSKNNNDDKLGYVLQKIGINGENAYLVLNKPNKIEIVDRTTFQKVGSISENLINPRDIAFHGDYIYVTNDNFTDTHKLNIYDKDHQYVKSINFARYAEKVVSVGDYVYVQTDGVMYTPNETATGLTIHRIDPSSNEADKYIDLVGGAPLRDMATDGTSLYVLSSDINNSFIYKINPTTGNYETMSLWNIGNARHLNVYNNKVYFFGGNNSIYTLNGTSADELFKVSTPNYIYGFNMINGYAFVSEASFTSESTVKVFNMSGQIVKSMKTGIATNGFYKN